MKRFKTYFLEQMMNRPSPYATNTTKYQNKPQQNQTANDLNKQAEQQRKQAYANASNGNTQAAKELNKKSNITSQAEMQKRQEMHQKRTKSVTTLSKSRIKAGGSIGDAMKQKNNMLKYQRR